MKIHYIELHNIGPYRGSQLFDFSTNEAKNIVLIGGKNGAGKTTLLKALKIGLFGCYSYGLKNETTFYYQEIQSLLNDSMKDDFLISISFSYTENLSVENYVVSRSWIVNHDQNRIEEQVSVVMNGEKLEPFFANEVIEKIRSISSPELINSFLFDGERIASVISEGNVAEYLQSVFFTMFGIDLIDQSIKDLQKYLKSEATMAKQDGLMENVVVLNTIESLKNAKKASETKIQMLKRNDAECNALKKSLMDEFVKIGGLSKRQYSDLLEKMRKIESDKETNNKIIREFVENDFPLYLNIQLLNETYLQCSRERQLRYFDYVDSLSSFLNLPLDNLQNALSLRIRKCERIHSVSDDQLSLLKSRAQRIMKNAEAVKRVVHLKGNSTEEYRVLRNSVVANENMDRIQVLIERIQKNDTALENNRIQLDKAISEHDKIEYNLQMNFEVYEKLSNEIRQANNIESSFVMANASIKALNRFRGDVLEKKLALVGEYACKVFDASIEKSGYVKRIIIDSNFDLKLQTNQDTFVSPKILSAGEMQLLISSLIWAMFKVSGRRELFVFDTPLARLDSANRIGFITEILSTISDQVVVLSTDSEFIGENYKAVKDKVYKTYLLSFDSNERQTKVSDGYFGG